MSLVKQAQELHRDQKQRTDLYQKMNKRFVRIYRDNIGLLRGKEKESLSCFLRSRLPTDAIYFIRCEGISEQQYKQLQAVCDVIEVDLKSESFSLAVYRFLAIALLGIVALGSLGIFAK